MTGQGDRLDELAARISAEIRSLRKGRGINSRDLARKTGPYLRELAGSSGAVDRQALTVELNACATRLAGDLRLAISAGLGLSRETSDMVFLNDRVSWLAARLGYGFRTALRRLDTAERLLAEEVATELARRRGHRPAAEGWEVAELRTVLRLDTPTPEAHEQRRIVATRDGVVEVTTSLDLPYESDEPRPGLEAEVLYGGLLVRREQPFRSRFQFAVRLPRSLRVGESHDYALILRLRDGRLLRPYYVCAPEIRHHAFDLRVRFDRGNLPRWVRRISGETVRMFEVGQPREECIVPDDAGEVHVSFENLTMYLGYGLQWAPR